MEERHSQSWVCSNDQLLTQLKSRLVHFLIKLLYFFTVVAIQAGLIAYRCKPIVCTLIPISLLLLYLAFHYYYFSRPVPVYLVDFSCLRPKQSYRVPLAGFVENASLLRIFDQKSVSFMADVIRVSGTGEETYFPPSLRYIPPRTQHEECIKEAELLYFPVMDSLLAKTHLSPLHIDVLIVNCSGFGPSPSRTSMIVHRYKMRDDVKTFNLSGMGCSAGGIGIDLARNILQNRRGNKCSYAVVLSGEILSTGWYSGKDRRKLLLNCVFRMGSSAILLTNRDEAPKQRAKYKISRVLRTNRSLDDKAYLCGFRSEDDEGITGFSIERTCQEAAAETLRANVSVLGRFLLPHSEIAKYVLSLIRKKLFINSSAEAPYVPSFSSAIQHYCMPVSGLPMLKELGKGLKLRREEMEPAAMSLHRFGNQSSASMWYEMAYMEAKGRVKKGDKIWQLWIGSGTKCRRSSRGVRGSTAFIATPLKYRVFSY
ncbi:hypothetical protein H6P81_001630 [Aristolochia fimbriata]|uniref:3-ketoacyl-CoA synthase n=1 Tax=Aristolochia fimbriata TaxID=158543 RepID=A0AAV7FAP7_ARIFI|nr:hypothetical protein H6P81_001630 [Aristolochia fimbriata]